MNRFVALILLLLLACAPAAAQEALYPPLEDPMDRQVQRLAVMSQRDEAFEGVSYEGGLLTQRGCLPVSMANSVIAAFGIEDMETARGVVTEAARVLVDPRKRGKVRAEMTYLPTLISPQDRAAQADKFPFLAATVGVFGGEVRLLDGKIDGERTREAIGEMQRPFVLAGRQSVHPDWTALMEIMETLSRMGYADAMVCLSHVGGGTEASGAPMRSGNGGHYLTLLMPVEAFMREGRVYVLDSLPRALEGEKSGYTEILRRPYPFTQEYSAFAQLFDASRISPTVIRLSLRETQAWRDADAAGKAEIFKPMILFGPGVVMISARE